MLALLLLIGSVTVAITGAYLQTQHLQDVADAQANSITRTMRTPDEASGSAAWEYASAYLAEVQPGQDFQALRLENVSVDSDHSVHVYLSARIRPPLLSILVPDGIEVTAHGSSRLKMNQAVHRLVRPSTAHGHIDLPAYWRVVSPLDCEGASAR